MTGDSQFPVLSFQNDVTIDYDIIVNFELWLHIACELNAFIRSNEIVFAFGWNEMREHASYLFIVFLRKSSLLTHQCLELKGIWKDVRDVCERTIWQLVMAFRFHNYEAFVIK